MIDFNNGYCLEHEPGPWQVSHPDGEPPAMYWESPQEQWPEMAGMAEEGYLAEDINWGRALIGVPSIATWDWTPLNPVPEGADSTDSYSDPIAAIINAACQVGIDPEWLCKRALHTARSTREESYGCARERAEASETKSAKN
ncbi:hypothetical protein G5V58_03945 [Nocardioides anomalus]|uniref:Uncharacterized protein n=1 Tax=Nocardioides anomalus TaxID=2712223 RepID=A0A6G6WAA3_9ACTN|nr:hypothetical protein [Nocardioides anomalus]QIG42035.1 hypothetical protein G5V58_03945 [Nocardioides anomalus]